MMLKHAVLILSMGLFGATTAEAGSITYAVSLFDATDQVAVGGSITTDGTLGTLTTSNILDWNLIGTALSTKNLDGGGAGPQLLFDLTGPISGNNSLLGANSEDIIATSTTLALNSDDPNARIGFFTPFPLDSISFKSLQDLSGFNMFVCRAQPFFDKVFCGTSTTAIPASTGIFADGVKVESVPTTPLPTALPLFATGLGGLGLLGWRRKRKARVSLLGAA